MVSTRRQSIGPPTDDLVIRARDSPDVRILRDGTIHGPTVDSPDRPIKRKRTTRTKALGTNASDADAEDSSVLETDSQQTPIKKGRGRPKKGRLLSDGNAREGSQLSSQLSETSGGQEEEKAGDTITVNSQDGTDAGAGTPEETQTTPKSKRSRGKSATPKKTSAAPKQDSVEKPAPSAPAHHRFDSAEPEEKDVDTTQATPQNEEAKKDDDEEDDEDEAPEQVNTTSSSLLQGLPTSIPTSQKKKSRSKKRKHEEEAEQEVEQLEDTDTTPQPQQQQEPHNPSKPSAPTLLTTTTTTTDQPPASTEDSNSPLSFTSAVSTQPTPSQPINKKEIFSSSTSISFPLSSSSSSYPSSTTKPRKKSKANGKGLPMKVNSQSKNMREQLLLRHRGGNKGGMKGGFGGGGKGGFLVR